ncbi:hypothetical protein D3C81_1827600 [compost metagenome]
MIEHFRQAVQGLRPKHHVDTGRTATDVFTFLRGHAATHADNQRRVLFFQQPPAAQHGENFFLRFLADRAGIEQQHVRFFSVVGPLITVRASQ